MSSIPAFHTRAASEAEARTKSAQSERDKAASFLDELDEVLADAQEPVAG